MPAKKQVALIVLDGWGHRKELEHNAIAEANTPFFDSLMQEYPCSTLDASEESVGLPAGQIGNSEVGHMTIGAGRTIDTDLVRITKAIRTGTFKDTPAFAAAFDHAKRHGSTLHLLGLVSSGGIHSHEEHIHALLEAAKEAGLKKVAIHAFTDGRDVAPQSAHKSLANLENLCETLGIGAVASVCGRFFAMDRDNNWDRAERAWKVICDGSGNVCEVKPSSKVEEMHRDGALDEHLEPMVCVDGEGRSYPLQENDAVIFANFRSDRARMLSELIAKEAVTKGLYFVTLTEYDAKINAHVAFPPQRVETTLAAEISKAGLTQAHIAETEKYPHATYFLNGGRETPHEGETHILVESRKDVPTHDLAPEMRAKEIADKAIEQIESGTNFLFINFANADMVGHTANVPAIITAVETVDRELKRVLDALHAKGGVAFITSDHGNAEVNMDTETGAKHTAHTLNIVPAILTEKGHSLASGTLADVAPTVLTIFGLPIPPSMNGKVLIG